MRQECACKVTKKRVGGNNVRKEKPGDLSVLDMIVGKELEGTE